MGAGFDPDSCTEKGDEHSQVTAQLFVPGEAVIKYIPGDDLNKANDCQSKDCPHQDGIFQAIKQCPKLLNAHCQYPWTFFNRYGPGKGKPGPWPFFDKVLYYC